MKNQVDRTKYAREWMRAWRKRNPDQSRANSRKNHQRPQTKFSVLKSEAKRRELEVSITLDQYLKIISNPCFYCGGPLPNGGGGLDRINSSIGYVLGNVRPCCTQCNVAKASFTELQFKEWALRLVNHWAGKI